MHAFVFYDKEKQHLILSTDHLGIKPLYYAIQNNNLTVEHYKILVYNYITYLP